MSHGKCTYQVKQIEEITAVRLEPKSDQETNIDAAFDEITQMIVEQQPNKVVLNMRNIEYLQSTSLGKIVTLDKRLVEQGGKLRLCGLQPHVKDLFEITGLDRAFDVQLDEEASLQEF